VTYKLLIYIAVLALLPLLSGCSQLGWKVSVVSVSAEDSLPSSITVQERRFAGALEFLRAGNELAARDLLEQVVEDTALSGVTDEALFRLSVLSLRDEGSKGAARALELLERLNHDFPKSIWNHQSSSLRVYLTGVKSIRDRQREVRSLKEQNFSLSRDNREMRQSIEKLKSLDIELEKKIKR
jgi:hypothetical protein